MSNYKLSQNDPLYSKFTKKETEEIINSGKSEKKYLLIVLIMAALCVLTSFIVFL